MIEDPEKRREKKEKEREPKKFEKNTSFEKPRFTDSGHGDYELKRRVQFMSNEELDTTQFKAKNTWFGLRATTYLWLGLLFVSIYSILPALSILAKGGVFVVSVVLLALMRFGLELAHTETNKTFFAAQDEIERRFKFFGR